MCYRFGSRDCSLGSGKNSRSEIILLSVADIQAEVRVEKKVICRFQNLSDF